MNPSSLPETPEVPVVSLAILKERFTMDAVCTALQRVCYLEPDIDQFRGEPDQVAARMICLLKLLSDDPDFAVFKHRMRFEQSIDRHCRNAHVSRDALPEITPALFLQEVNDRLKTMVLVDPSTILHQTADITERVHDVLARE